MGLRASCGHQAPDPALPVSQLSQGARAHVTLHAEPCKVLVRPSALTPSRSSGVLASPSAHWEEEPPVGPRQNRVPARSRPHSWGISQGSVTPDGLVCGCGRWPALGPMCGGRSVCRKGALGVVRLTVRPHSLLSFGEVTSRGQSHTGFGRGPGSWLVCLSRPQAEQAGALPGLFWTSTAHRR